MNIKIALSVATILFSTSAFARDTISITGSSTVFPFTQAVAENFQGNTPIVESVGTGAGVKIFCGGIGEDSPDIVNASRPMKDTELQACTDAGVTAIEVKFGYDGIVIASDTNGPDFVLTAQDVYKALAANLVIDGQLVANPYTKWNEINPALPDWKIDAYIPGEKHGTREVFEHKLLDVGCDKEALKTVGQSDDDIKKTCIAVRKDGYVSDIAGDYSETLARLQANPQAIGVFGISFYIENEDKIKVASVDGIVPSLETIASGEYPVSRPLFIYVKKEHIGAIPGLKEFLQEYVNDAAIGDEGYLTDIGLIPMPEEERISVQELVNNL